MSKPNPKPTAPSLEEMLAFLDRDIKRRHPTVHTTDEYTDMLAAIRERIAGQPKPLREVRQECDNFWVYFDGRWELGHLQQGKAYTDTTYLDDVTADFNDCPAIGIPVPRPPDTKG